MELSGGICGALAAGTVDASGWVPAARDALTAACAAGAPAVGAAVAAWWLLASALVAGAVGTAVWAAAGRKGV